MSESAPAPTPAPAPASSDASVPVPAPAPAPAATKTTSTPNPATSTPIPAPAPTAEAKVTGELDLVFCMDCTGSMGSYIASAQQNIINIVEKIVASEKVDVQFGLVAYRDHPPQDQTFVTKVFDFTSSRKEMEKNVSSLSAAGGGDGPEAVTAGLHAVLKMPYRKNSTRIAVIIADAPPHGLGESGDGFPNGDPNGLDPIKVAKEMLENKITLYSVACEPALSSSYKYAVDFFDAIAKITGGKFLALASAKLLADVIVGTAAEEISLAKLMTDLEKEIEEQKKTSGKPLSDDDMVERVHTAMASKGIKSRHVEVDNVYSSRDAANAEVMLSSESLTDARKQFKSVAKPTLNAAVFSGSSAAPASAAPLSRARKSSETSERVRVSSTSASTSGGGGGGGFFSSLFSRNSSAKSEAKDSAPVPPSSMSLCSEEVEVSEALAPSSAPMPVMQEQSARIETATISKSQVSNMMRKAKAQNKY